MANTTTKSAKASSYSFARIKAKVRVKLRIMKIQGMSALSTNPAQGVADVLEEVRRRLSKRKVPLDLTRGHEIDECGEVRMLGRLRITAREWESHVEARERGPAFRGLHDERTGEDPRVSSA